MQSLEYEIRPAALVEFIEAHLWYHGRSELAALRFDQALARAAQLILEGPERWQHIGEGYRQIRVRGFPYFLIYRSNIRPIPIVAVAHASREPGYWRERDSDE